MARYKIIWADDDIHALYKGAEPNLKDYNFEVIAKCICGQELERELQRRGGERIDAVIVDANFPDEDEDAGFNDRQIDGLETAIVELTKYPHIPFYLYSGKGKLVKDLKERVKKHFAARNAIFDKENGIEPLLERIKEDIEYRRTPEFVIDNNFEKEIGYAKAFDMVMKNVTEGEKFVRQNLIHSYENSWDFDNGRPQEILNGARKLVEAMFDFLKREDLAILPPIRELNGITQFLSRGELEAKVGNGTFIYKKLSDYEIMSKPLVRSVRYLLDIVQDGSHLKGVLRLGVDQYLTATRNANLLRAILHIMIDLFRWFVEYVPSHIDAEINRLNWDCKEKI